MVGALATLATVMLTTAGVAPALAQPPGGPGTQVTAGTYHTCARDGDGRAYCWGDAGAGQTGSESDSGLQLTPAIVATGVPFTQLAAGGYHTCGLAGDGTAYCWGAGAGVSPVAVTAAVPFTQLAAGSSHTCGLGSDGKAYCWGANGQGQLGDGSTSNRSTPVAVDTATTFTQLTAGGFHTCGLAGDGTAHCWGQNVDGRLGDGSTTNRPAPVAVDAAVTFTRLTAGGYHTCGLGSDAKAYCWGNDDQSQLGDDDTTSRPTPVEVAGGAVPGGVTFTQLAAGATFTCGLGSDAQAYCWGFSHAGQVGDGGTTDQPRSVSTPVAVVAGAIPIGVTLTQLSAGSGHVCAVGSDAGIYCWGYGTAGQLGDGGGINQSSPVAVSTLALPPTGVTAVPGGGQVVVSWSAPANLGSGTLTGYTATASPGGQTCVTAGATTCTITGLTNGSAYTVTVTATTTVGTSAASSPSSPVTPSVGPQPPIGVTAVPGGGQVVVSWSAPADLGSGTLTGYTATASPGGRTCLTAGATMCTIAGLTNGTAYTVTVTATTTVGTSAASSPSSPVTPSVGPQSPTGVTAVPGGGQVVVSWSAPTNLGSGTLTGYTATASPGGRTCQAAGATTCTITGLTNGTAYTVAVTATTTVGTSAPSSPSSPVTPSVGPQPPTGVTADPGDRQVVASWTAPADTGSGTLTGYTATASPGGQTCVTVGATTCTIAGLTNGTAYTVTAIATTTVGTSAASSPSAPVTPSAGPKTPIGVTVTAGDRSITVAWDPAEPGTDTPIKYTATATPSGKTCTISSSSIHGGICTIHGLINGTAYTVTLTATNKAGTSPPTEPSKPVTPVDSPPTGRPQPPVVTATQPQNETIAVSWNPGSPGTGTLLGYTATATATRDPCTSTTTPCISTATRPQTATDHTTASAEPTACTTTDSQTCTITGLINGTSYQITVTTHTTTGDSEADSTGPEVITTPDNGILVRGTHFTTTVEATDPAGIGRSYLTGPDGQGRPDSYTTADVPTGKDGNRTVTWIVLDKLGNQTTARRTVTVDNTAPTVAFRKAPANGARVAKPTKITATANDRNGIARVELMVNGRRIAADTRPGYTFTLNPTRYGKKFSVTIRAYDRAGNVRQTSRRNYHR
ncbi:hypothetical protein Q0Z83_038910 [Actinoplanes sichuanensis]|nr:hypothetical protein Q0Z83_038910 [Actinoplanes sichuanensis]